MSKNFRNKVAYTATADDPRQGTSTRDLSKGQNTRQAPQNLQSNEAETLYNLDI